MKKETRQNSPKIKYSFIRILTGSDLARRRLPFMSAISPHKGPTIFLTACLHGDEVGGIVIIQELFKIIKKELIKGAVYAFPLMNPIGFETSSRFIPQSEEDLNRCFPGNPQGSLAERIANKIFTTITETKPHIVIDLHNDWNRSIPYTLIDMHSNDIKKEVYKETMDYAEKSGFILIQDSEQMEKTLTHSLLKHDIPAITLELGESYVVNEKNIEHGVNSICNILAHLGMVADDCEFFKYFLTEKYLGNLYSYTHKPLSSSSGVIRYFVKPGDIIKKGQVLARIYNTFGKIVETMIAQQDSIVLGLSDFAVAFPGRPLIAKAIFKETK